MYQAVLDIRDETKNLEFILRDLLIEVKELHILIRKLSEEDENCDGR